MTGRAAAATAGVAEPAGTGGRLHVAIIMDGNGRWATARGLPRVEGHVRGAEAVRRTVGAALKCGVGTLTLYAFSRDNWYRPSREVLALMTLFETFLRDETTACAEQGIRVSIIGSRDRLAPALAAGVEAIEAATADGRRMHLRIAVDYSARHAIYEAARHVARAGRISYDDLVAAIASGRGEPADVPDVDLLIRTGGEQRLSDFLLWESAYAELWFTPVMWPDFGEADFRAALEAFGNRERRFGRLPGSA